MTKEEYSQLSEQSVKAFFLFQLYVCEDSLLILQMKQHLTTDYKTRIQLWSSKSDIKEICKDVK